VLDGVSIGTNSVEDNPAAQTQLELPEIVPAAPPWTAMQQVRAAV
jgi:hypothetical protein